jgi:hypothetical protein
VPDYQTLAEQIARKQGIGDWFVRQIKQESGFDPNAGSPAGALGIAQIVPRYHPDAPAASDPVGQLNWAAKYMKGLVSKYGNVAQALSVYNSGRPDKYLDPNFASGQTYRYVKSILGGTTPSVPTRGMPGGATVPAGGPALPSTPDLTPVLLSNLSGHRRAEDQLSDLVSAVMGRGAPGLVAPPYGGAPFTSSPSKPMYAGKGMVKLAANANRGGVGLAPGILQFADRVSGIAGEPLTIGTGTNHNRYVLGSNRESAHWTGRAADIPASGAKLTKIGQDALIAAGMAPAQARKVKGGLFNLGGYQVIFNSHEGGNHFNHLHIGLRG